MDTDLFEQQHEHRQLASRFNRLSRGARILGASALLQIGGMVAIALRAQTAPAQTEQQTPVVLPEDMAAVPFGVGEKLEYELKYGSWGVGKASMEVKDISNVRDRPSWHTVFKVKGKITFYSIDDTFESWFDVSTLSTRRFRQDIDEGSYETKRNFEIYPERGMYRQDQREEMVTVNAPLDEGSFFYFMRTIPLVVGETLSFSRYFKPDGNPVKIRVLRKDTIKVPAGTFKTIVVQPTIKTRGFFSEGGRAEVWLTDDTNRVMVQMKVHLPVGSVNLFLAKITPGAGKP